jgi:hypothetical protein
MGMAKSMEKIDFLSFIFLQVLYLFTQQIGFSFVCLPDTVWWNPTIRKAVRCMIDVCTMCMGDMSHVSHPIMIGFMSLECLYSANLPRI